MRFTSMRLYALVEAGDPDAIDVYLCEQDAQRALEDCLRERLGLRGGQVVLDEPADHTVVEVCLWAGLQRSQILYRYCQPLV
jgi:hypothetical protein